MGPSRTGPPAGRDAPGATAGPGSPPPPRARKGSGRRKGRRALTPRAPGRRAPHPARPPRSPRIKGAGGGALYETGLARASPRTCISPLNSRKALGGNRGVAPAPAHLYPIK